MNEQNKYNILSGGWIFDYLDKKGQETAENDNKCKMLTRSSSIVYLKQCLNKEEFLDSDLNIVYKDYKLSNNKKATVVYFENDYIKATFSYIEVRTIISDKK